MTEMQRIEKTTEIFSKSDRNSLGTTINEVQSVIDDYFNEHLSSVSALESPFIIKSLETRLKLYKKEMEQHPDIMLIYDLLNSFESSEKITTIKMPNAFNMKAGDNDD